MPSRRMLARQQFGSGIGPLGMGGYAGGVGTAADAASGIYAPPRIPTLGIDFSRASTWSWFWFAAAVAYLTFVYAAHGGRRGAVI